MSWMVQQPTLRIRIFTEGPLAAFGHDRVFDQPVSIGVNANSGLDGAAISVAGDLRNTALIGNATPSDRADILRRKDREVLRTDKYPDLRFEGEYHQEKGIVSGSLTLHGTTRPVDLPVALSQADDSFSIEGTVPVDLSAYGVKPYKAFLGGLRVKSVVEVSYSLLLKQTR